MFFPRVHPRRRTNLLVVGILCVGLGTLPWFGLGGYAFAIPGWDTSLPRLDLFRGFDDHTLYDTLSFPPALLAEVIPPLRDVVYFAGEGVRKVRPFIVFLFWHVVGCISLWLAVRRGEIST